MGAIITLKPGQRILGVELLLIETVLPGSESIFKNDAQTVAFDGTINRSGNLLAFSADLSANGADGRFEKLVVNSSGGGPSPINDGDTVGYFALGIFGQTGVMPTTTDADTAEAVLGTVDLIAPLTGSTTFTLADYSMDDGDFTTFSTGSLEAAARGSGGSFNPNSLTLTAVPEPSALLHLIAVFACIGLKRSRLQA
ncbi:hypothetical protein [Crateriforma conspicua]|uniref:hypothetical protein n=1 Tax=Crateriforma conspicua TaxID=2527996 RepID=UPI0011A10ECB|nr:hypothetical protein [Crateriforma conspicua]